MMMGDRVHIPLGLRLMAFVCRICPCCVIARRWPNSGFARRFRKVQHGCPFCRARARVIQIMVEAESQAGERVSVRRGDEAPPP
jgi:hypothetical protein